MSLYTREDKEWEGFRQNEITVIKKLSERPYYSSSNGKKYEYKMDVLLCKCDCGVEWEVNAKSLIHNNVQSCRGCNNRKIPIGEKFGKLTVVDWFAEKNKSGRSMVYWVCGCECGEKYQCRSDIIKTDNISCCQKCSKGSKFITKGTNSKRYFNSVRCGAKRRKIEISISEEYIVNLLISQQYKCALSGISISFEDGTASLDRINNKLGYSECNVQWIHRTINYMKNELSEVEFIRFCTAIVEHRKN